MHGWNFADDRAPSLVVGNRRGITPYHGTHCAGTIAANTNNCRGIAGIAGRWFSSHGCSTSSAPAPPPLSDDDDGAPGSVRLMIAVTFGESRTGGFAEAIAYAADNGASVSSNSWAYALPGLYDRAVIEAIDYFNAKTHGFVVFAAGNKNSSSDYYPASSPSVVSVAAVDKDNLKYARSNFGPWVDLAAPGVDVLSTQFDDGYARLSGTSMACPHVTGVLALAKTHAPHLPRHIMLACLHNSTDALDSRFDLGKGLLNATRFLACVQQADDAEKSTT